jgi:glycosyltransferase involved in cell wall biosynthesis
MVVVTPAFKDHLIKHWNVPPEKISVVQNGVETDLFKPRVPDARLRQEWDADGKFIVCYIGTMGWAHGLETLVAAAEQLRNSQVVFVLVGEGADKARILDLIATKGLTNVRIVNPQPREKIPAYIASADACLVLLKKTDIFKTVIPTKMLEFMACGRAVILGVEGQAREIIEEAGAGIAVAPEDAEQLAKAILTLAGDPQQREVLGARGREHILRYFSRETTASEYIGVLQRILAGSGST